MDPSIKAASVGCALTCAPYIVLVKDAVPLHLSRNDGLVTDRADLFYTEIVKSGDAQSRFMSNAR
jgi:hypothetical protein